MLRVKFSGGQVEVIREAGSRVDVKVADNYIEVGKLKPVGNIFTGFKDGSESIRIEFEGPLDVFVHYERLRPKEDESSKPTPVKVQPPLKSVPNKTNTDYVVEAIQILGRPFRTTDELRPYLERTGFKSGAKKVGSVIRYYLSTDKRIVKSDSGWGLAEWKDDTTQNEQTHDVDTAELEVSAASEAAEDKNADTPESQEAHPEPSL